MYLTEIHILQLFVDKIKSNFTVPLKMTVFSTLSCDTSRVTDRKLITYTNQHKYVQETFIILLITYQALEIYP